MVSQVACHLAPPLQNPIQAQSRPSRHTYLLLSSKCTRRCLHPSNDEKYFGVAVILLIENKYKFQMFKFLQLKIQSHQFKNNFQSFKFLSRKVQVSISCFLEDINPIFNTRFPFHVFVKDVDPIFKILKTY